MTIFISLIHGSAYSDFWSEDEDGGRFRDFIKRFIKHRISIGFSLSEASWVGGEYIIIGNGDYENRLKARNAIFSVIDQAVRAQANSCDACFFIFIDLYEFFDFVNGMVKTIEDLTIDTNQSNIWMTLCDVCDTIENDEIIGKIVSSCPTKNVTADTITGNEIKYANFAFAETVAKYFKKSASAMDGHRRMAEFLIAQHSNSKINFRKLEISPNHPDVKKVDHSVISESCNGETAKA